MLFIFGIGPKTIQTDRGQFKCPVCRSDTAYEIKQ